jgi:hypothetical protein
MARKSKLARSRQRTHLFLGSMALLLVIGMVSGTAWWWSQKKSGIDPNTLCPSDGPIGHHVLLIDKTDPFNLPQKAAFDLIVTDLVTKQTPPGYLLSIYVLGDDFKSQTKPLVELCNPGDAKGHSEFTENIKQLNRQYKERFLKPVFAQSTELLSVTTAQESPILEMLQMVNLNSLQKHDVDGPKQLIVLSDLLQNSKHLSMYKSMPDFDVFNATAYAQKTKVNFEGVEIKVHLLQNVPQLQKQNLFDFWKKYFSNSGATQFELIALPG